jgi:hypothetical protein
MAASGAGGDGGADDHDAPRVTGTVVISAAVPPMHGAVVQVRLEDVTLADAAAETVAIATIPGVEHEPARGETGVPFALTVAGDTIKPRRRYTVRVWVDRDGDGRAGPGDLYSDRSYPVTSDDIGRPVTVVLEPR